jgi:MFS family permease
MPAAFTSRNCCAVIFAASVVGLMIAAAVAPWYSFTQEFDYTIATSGTGNVATQIAGTPVQINQTKIYYDLTGLKTTFSVSGSVQTSTFQNYPSNDNLRNITKTSQAFVLMALIAGFILLVLLFTFFFDRIRNKLIFAVGMTLTRLVAVAFCALITISVIIAFLVYIGVVQAFKQDSNGCVDGPCRSFVSSSSTTSQGTVNGQAATITQTLTWGPIEGWYITLGTTVPAVILMLLVVVNKFPLPIDSEASSGEAL